MGKGSGSCADRPALAIGEPVAVAAPASHLKSLLRDEDLKSFLGEDWVKHAQERTAAEMLGPEPAETVSAPVDADDKKRLRLLVVRKGPMDPEVRALRAKIAAAGAEAANPAHAAWVERREMLLGVEGKIAGHRVWKGGQIDPASAAEAAAMEVAGEIEVFREEREAQERALNGDTVKASSYSKWVSHALFSGDAKSGWHTTPEGRVVFLGYAEQVKHLGVAAKNFVKRDDITVGYRYWGIDKDGRLTAPISSGLPWAPGVNQAEGWKTDNEADTAGLYAFKHNAKDICAKDYFDIRTGKKGSERVMITANAMWNARDAWGEAIKAEYAAPAVFLILPTDSEAWKAKVRKAAEIYHGRVAGPEEMYGECLDWAKTELAEF